MATMTGSIKESLVGTTEEPQLSQEVRLHFMKHARPDETGELSMGPEEFIDAIAPAEEDYVGCTSFSACCVPLAWKDLWTNLHALLTCLSQLAQDKTRTVFHPFSSCRPAKKWQGPPV